MRNEKCFIREIDSSIGIQTGLEYFVSVGYVTYSILTALLVDSWLTWGKMSYVGFKFSLILRYMLEFTPYNVFLHSILFWKSD